MNWKKSKDGGLDFDATKILNQEKSEEQNPAWSGQTITTNFSEFPYQEFGAGNNIGISVVNPDTKLKFRTKFEKRKRFRHGS